MPAPAPAEAPAPRLDRARAGRRLDPRRLPQLGQRARLRALAPGQEARAHPAGADRRRQARELQPARACGRWAKWLLDRSLRSTTAQPAGAGGLPDAVFFGVSRCRRASAARAGRRARAGERRARLAAGLGRAAPPQPPRAVRLRPRHRPAGRHHAARTTPRSSRSTSARSRTAASSSRDSSTATSTSRRTSAARGSAAFGVRVRAAPGRLVSFADAARPRLAGGTPLRLTRAPRGVGARPERAARGSTRGASTDLRATGSVTSAAGG